MKWGLFSPKALKFIDKSNARLNILHGSVRSTKTINTTVRWLEYIVNGPPGTLVMTGKTRTTLQRNVLDDIEDIVGPKCFRWIRKDEGLFSVYGRKIYAIGANDEKAESKLRGATFAGAACDEVSLYPESFFRQLLARLSITGAQMFATTNPDSPFHWFYRDFITNEQITDKLVWHFLLDDNLNLSEAFKNALKQEYTGLWYKRMILGLWVMAEGAIYDMFDERYHVKEIAGNIVGKQFVTIDYGTANPTVFLRGLKLGNALHYADEYYYDSRATGRQKTDSEYATDLLKFLGPNYKIVPAVIDPSAASFIVECERRGINVERADNSVLDGIRDVASLLAQKRLSFSPRCKNTIAEFQSYVWDAKEQKKGIDAPLKENDHGADAARYGVRHAFSGNEITAFTIKY